VTLEDVATFELPAAELARIGSGDAALVALVAHQRGLVQVRAPTPGARVLVGERVAGRVAAATAVLGVVNEVHGAGKGGERVVQQREDGTKAALACTQQVSNMLNRTKKSDKQQLENVEKKKVSFMVQYFIIR
jgi:hypothetical protein